LTDIFISLTFKPSQYDLVSLILVNSDLSRRRYGGGKQFEVDGSKLLTEIRVTKEDRITWEGSTGEPSPKGNELIA
jgi:hypothetical protein